MSPGGSSRGFWLRQMHQWHWISAALCLIGMMLFAITGITLNHASQIKAVPEVQTQQAILPAAVLEVLQSQAGTEPGNAPVPDVLSDWLADQWAVRPGNRAAEWSADEIYLSLPRPGGDGWVSVDLDSGAVEYERTDRGWISYFNDLHKGRNSGVWWSWFLDLFAVACLVFCVTGLILLKLHAAQRVSTWPVVGLGLLLPLLIAILFIH